jgi:hypothetical protein
MSNVRGANVVSGFPAALWRRFIVGVASTPRGGGASAPNNRRERQESRPVSRVLSRAIIPLGSTSPWTSSGLPGSARGSAPHPLAARKRERWVLLPYLALLQVGFAVPSSLPSPRCALTAPFHPCRASLARDLGRFAFCCTFRGLAPPRRYLAPDPPEPGLSSIRALRRRQRLPGRLPAPHHSGPGQDVNRRTRRS